jgi:hypothetical protein
MFVRYSLASLLFLVGVSVAQAQPPGVPPVPAAGQITTTIGTVGVAPGRAGEVQYFVRWGAMPGATSVEMRLVKVVAGGPNVFVEGPVTVGPAANGGGPVGNIYGPSVKYPKGTQVYVQVNIIGGAAAAATSVAFTIP